MAVANSFGMVGGALRKVSSAVAGTITEDGMARARGEGTLGVSVDGKGAFVVGQGVRS
ncbi:MAG TPA: hypothetical protein VFS00_32455 [Polyangiaceae bacterium]|nr:hypothetical protein [Polyangiaceae bacterium]